MISKSVKATKDFVSDFFNQSAIHGFGYVGNSFLHVIERFLWVVLIGGALYQSINLSLESWHRYLYGSTVVAIERDHYYWNTSLPGLTICPMERISKEMVDAYCERNNIENDEKEDFYNFLESLANSTYANFGDIKNSTKVDEILKRLKIEPSDYMRLIYELTEDLTRRPDQSEYKVRTFNNLEFIKTTQVLTEYGICYSTNNMLAVNLSTSLLLNNKLPADDDFYKRKTLHDVRYGNLFDGEVTYNFIGFNTPMTVFMHSPYETMNVARSIGYTKDAYEFETMSIEIITTKDFKDTLISQRGCRFHWESNLTHYRVYSKNLCMAECRLKLAYKHCKCIPHFYANRAGKRICDYRELKSCFPKHKNLFLEFQATKHGDEKVQCYCLQNCLDSNVIVENFKILTGTTTLLGGSIGGLVIMKKYPLIRFQREVIFTLTDFFVSIGGTAGFFIGCSVLGVIEIIYFFSLRLFWFVFGYRN